MEHGTDHLKLAYDDAAPLREMAADCAAVDRALGLGTQHGRATTASVPHDEWDPTVVEVSAALAAMAGRLELHLG